MDSLALLYGSRSLVLHGSGATPPVRGARRLPPAPLPGRDGTCTETIDVLLEGSPAALAGFVAAVESCLARAEYRTDPVRLALGVDGEPAPWQSPVLGGRAAYLDSGSSDRTRGMQTLRLALVRPDYWEGAEQWAPLSNHNGSGVTTGLQVENHQDDAHQNHVDVELGGVGGDLPAPARLELVHAETAPSRTITDLWMGAYLDSVHAPPGVILEGESATTELATSVVAASTASAGFYRRVSWLAAGEVELMAWTLSASLLGALAGRTVLPLVRFAAPFPAGDVWVQLRVQAAAGAPAHTSEWVLLKPGLGLQELPAMALPPWQLPGDTLPALLNLSLHATRGTSGSLSVDLDFIQLTPMDCWRKFTSTVPLTYGTLLADDLPRRLCYTITAAGETVTHAAVGEPLIVWPGRNQRIHILHTPDPMAIDTRMLVRLAYRPRRRVL